VAAAPAHLFDSGEWAGHPFLVMELLEGATLQDTIKQQVQPPSQVLDWSLQLLDGLAAAHAQTVLHRDLKPSNIFLTTSGSIKLLDFGVAKDWDRSKHTTTLETLTRPGAAVGTWAYMSPEQLRALPVDHRADLFSIGVVLFEVCTGRQPFAAPSISETLDRVLYETPPSPRELDAAVPAGLSAVIMRAIAKEPESRYQTVVEMQRDLDDLKRPMA
jgi:eukaryotic-like serine/threonine-protein kinase